MAALVRSAAQIGPSALAEPWEAVVDRVRALPERVVGPDGELPVSSERAPAASFQRQVVADRGEIDPLLERHVASAGTTSLSARSFGERTSFDVARHRGRIGAVMEA